MAEDVTYVGDEEYAPFWNPSPGESITGKVVSAHVMHGDYGPTPVVTVENAQGQHAILVRGTVFREAMAERRPKVGEELGVTYLGKKAPKSGRGNPYHVYRVAGAEGSGLDWDAFVDPSRRLDQPEQDVPIEPAPVPPAAPAPEPTPPPTYGIAPEHNPDDVPF